MTAVAATTYNNIFAQVLTYSVLNPDCMEARFLLLVFRLHKSIAFPEQAN